jgi:hypothetical protein
MKRVVMRGFSLEGKEQEFARFPAAEELMRALVVV